MKNILLAILLISPLSQAGVDDIRDWSRCATWATALDLNSEQWVDKLKSAQRKMSREDAIIASWRYGYQHGYYTAKGFHVEANKVKWAKKYKKLCVVNG